MSYKPYKGATLLIPHNGVPHLFVVMNDPCEKGLCLLVMISSIKANKHHDDACVLKKGDHKFITHSSYAVYRIANQSRADHLSSMVDKNYFTPKEDVASSLYDRLLAGFAASEEATNSMLAYLKSVKLL